MMTEDEIRGLDRAVGSHHYRAYVGFPDRYDELAALQFRVLTELGLRDIHRVLDLGCGSLRLGRLLLPYLLPNRYVGVEPERWLVDDAIRYELGATILDVKQPQFCFDPECELDHFGAPFDFIVAQSVITHAPFDWVERCARRLASALKRPDGLVVGTYLDGTTHYVGKDWVYPGCVNYRHETLDALFASVGLAFRTLDHYSHPAGVRWFSLKSRNSE